MMRLRVSGRTSAEPLRPLDTVPTDTRDRRASSRIVTRSSIFQKRFWNRRRQYARSSAKGQGQMCAKLHGVIGVLREGPLHRELKRYLAAPGDTFEVRVDGYVIDLVRTDGELVEVQTGGFSAL